MAYVSDWTEDELAQALQGRTGGATVATSGAGRVIEAPNPNDTAVGSAPPPPGAQPGAGDAGTGFVNLSNYFAANEGGANAMAGELVGRADDSTAARDALRGLGPAPEAPAAPSYQTLDYDPNALSSLSPEQAQEGIDQANAAIRAKYESELAAYQSLLDNYNSNATTVQNEAVQGARNASLDRARSFSENPGNLTEAMTKNGTAPSAFDAYLTGAAAPQAYSNLAAYYSANPYSATPQGPGPGRMFSTTQPTGSTTQAPGSQPTVPGASTQSPSGGTAAEVLNPNRRKGRGNNLDAYGRQV